MTVGALIKKLQRIEKEVGSRAKVVVALEEFRLIDMEYSHWEAHDVVDDFIPWAQPTRELADGSERMKRVVSII